MKRSESVLQKILSPFVEMVPEAGAATAVTAPQTCREVCREAEVDPEHAALCAAIMTELQQETGRACCTLQLMDALDSLQADFPDEMQSLKAAFRVLKLEKSVVEEDVARVLKELESREEASLNKLEEREREELSRREKRCEEIREEVARLEERLAHFRGEREQLEEEMARERQSVTELRRSVGRAFVDVKGKLGRLALQVRHYTPKG